MRRLQFIACRAVPMYSGDGRS